MKIYINNIKINSITNVGSLNIGKTILANNRASKTEHKFTTPNEGRDDEEESTQNAHENTQTKH